MFFDKGLTTPKWFDSILIKAIKVILFIMSFLISMFMSISINHCFCAIFNLNYNNKKGGHMKNSKSNGKGVVHIKKRV
jgi:hypothetical protein